jgi:hypothetical protein
VGAIYSREAERGFEGMQSSGIFFLPSAKIIGITILGSLLHGGFGVDKSKKEETGSGQGSETKEEGGSLRGSSGGEDKREEYSTSLGGIQGKEEPPKNETPEGETKGWTCLSCTSVNEDQRVATSCSVCGMAREWSCPQCTLHNPFNVKVCGVCEYKIK